VNEFIILLQNAAGAGWVFLLAIAAVAIGMFIFDRPKRAQNAAQQQGSNDRKAA
jgi:hypothetical protein